MKSLKFIVLAVVVALFGGSAYANKRLYTTRLSTDNELHEVIGSRARGSAVLGPNANGSGFVFQLVVNGLSGVPSGVHLHAPATETETAPVIVTLCGNPAPAAIATCPALDADGNFAIQGLISSSLAAQWGLPGNVFATWLNDSLVYVNVHTAINPAGEVRGQLRPY